MVGGGGGGVKSENRNKTGTRQEQDRNKTGTRQEQDRNKIRYMTGVLED